jgi:dihydroorotase
MSTRLAAVAPLGTIAIRGGTVVDSAGSRRADVLVGDGRVTAVDPASDDGPAANRTLDASGCIVAPGLVDLHAHLRQPGREDAETIDTGASGAALGGFTAVVAMPNTDPPMDCAAVVREVQDLGAGACCDVYPSAAITVGRRGTELAPMAELVRLGVRIFTDDGDGVQDAQVMRRALEYAGGLDHLAGGRRIVLAQHCEVAELSAGGYMHEGAWSSRLGLGGQPAEAEELMVMRDIALARLTGSRVHFQHLSTAGSVAMVRAAKEAGLPVTAEATPHHFTLTDASCASYDTVFKVHPPLRTDGDVAAIRAGLADGTIDAIATDHAPHTSTDKERPFDAAPPGMLGLETALGLALTELDLPVEQVLALMSWQPAAIASIDDRHGGPIAPGAPANLCVIDPQATWTVSGAAMAGPSRNTPYEGWTLRGRVRHTLLAGEPVVIDGEPQR